MLPAADRQAREICLASTRTKIPLAQIVCGLLSPRKVMGIQSCYLEHLLTDLVTFVDVKDPYAEETLDPVLDSPDTTISAPVRAEWSRMPPTEVETMELPHMV